MSSPDVKKMTTADWLFEYHALRNKEQLYVESGIKILKNILVSVLGLNAIRPESGNGTPKPFDEMTEAEREDFLPLVAWVGRVELLQHVKKQFEAADTSKPGSFYMDEDEYEKLVNKIDESGGDMEPILGLDTIPTSKPSDAINKDNISVEGDV